MSTSEKSVVCISRDEAINRIIFISGLITHRRHSTLMGAGMYYEPEICIEDYEMALSNLSTLTEWTNERLSELMSKPFFRYNYRNDYVVED